MFKNFDLDNDKGISIAEVEKCLDQNKISMQTEQVKEVLMQNKCEDINNIDFDNFAVVWEYAEKTNK